MAYNQNLKIDSIMGIDYSARLFGIVFSDIRLEFLERHTAGVKLNVICNGNVIESKSNVTYLGVTLDQFLSGEIIASNILYKSSNKLKFLYRNAGKFNLETKKLLISALIQCHFDYTC